LSVDEDGDIKVFTKIDESFGLATYNADQNRYYNLQNLVTD